MRCTDKQTKEDTKKILAKCEEKILTGGKHKYKEKVKNVCEGKAGQCLSKWNNWGTEVGSGSNFHCDTDTPSTSKADCRCEGKEGQCKSKWGNWGTSVGKGSNYHCDTNTPSTTLLDCRGKSSAKHKIKKHPKCIQEYPYFNETRKKCFKNPLCTSKTCSGMPINEKLCDQNGIGLDDSRIKTNECWVQFNNKEFIKFIDDRKIKKFESIYYKDSGRKVFINKGRNVLRKRRKADPNVKFTKLASGLLNIELTVGPAGVPGNYSPTTYSFRTKGEDGIYFNTHWPEDKRWRMSIFKAESEDQLLFIIFHSFRSTFNVHSYLSMTLDGKPKSNKMQFRWPERTYPNGNKKDRKNCEVLGKGKGKRKFR